MPRYTLYLILTILAGFGSWLAVEFFEQEAASPAVHNESQVTTPSENARVIKTKRKDAKNDVKEPSFPETEASPYYASLNSKTLASQRGHPKISAAASEALESYGSGQTPKSYLASQVRFDELGFVQLYVQVARFDQAERESVWRKRKRDD